MWSDRVFHMCGWVGVHTAAHVALFSDAGTMGCVVNAGGDLCTWKVASLNLWCADVAWEERHHSAGTMLGEVGAQVACVQEVADERATSVLEILEHASGMRVVAYEPGGGDIPSGTAILVRGVGTGETAISGTYRDGGAWRAACAVVTSTGGRLVRVCSAHLCWGGRNEHRRIDQVVQLDREMLTRGTVHGSLLAGDMNALSDAASMRYLRGLEPVDGTCAQWTDAWAVAGSGRGYTSSPSNEWARVTAAAHGFEWPTMLPNRRIDYIYVEGYAHGRALSPVRCVVMDDIGRQGIEPSDHWAVIADLYDPDCV